MLRRQDDRVPVVVGKVDGVDSTPYSENAVCSEGRRQFSEARPLCVSLDTDGRYFFTKGLELASLDEALERFHEPCKAAEIRQVEGNLLPIHSSVGVNHGMSLGNFEGGKAKSEGPWNHVVDMVSLGRLERVAKSLLLRLPGTCHSFGSVAA